MRSVVAIRRETKSPWERRSPLTPEMVRHLVSTTNVKILVQPAVRRVYRDKEFVRAGAEVKENLSDANLVLGVKEIPPQCFEPATAYLFFSHVIKGQEYNMPMLAKMMELGCTLIDYEKVADDQGRRLIFFGRFAGIAGMVDSLWTLGQRLRAEGTPTPFSEIQASHAYESLVEAKAAVRKAGQAVERHGVPASVAPLIIGVAGYGNVAKGALEIISELPAREIQPERVAELATDSSRTDRAVYYTVLKEEHIVTPNTAGKTFELQDYYDHPAGYRSTFGVLLPHLTLVMNCNYWDDRYPRLITKAQLKQLFAAPTPPRLKVIGDLGCDVKGAVECTLKCTEPSEPVYVYDPDTDRIEAGFAGRGPVVLAVDILPAELPREASEEFSRALQPFVPAMAAADYSVPFEDLDLPDEIRRAVIVHRGQLTPEYAYLEEHVMAGAKTGT